MILLAFETSTSKGGVAVLKGEDGLAKIQWDRSTTHGELLTPAIERALHESKQTLSSIDAIAVGHGPGSFTGVRIAVNAARSLAFAGGKKIFAYDTAEMLAAGANASLGSPGDESSRLPILALINAQKNAVFASRFSAKGERLSPLALVSIDDLVLGEPHLVVGDGYLEYLSLVPASLSSMLVRDSRVSDYPDPEILGRVAWRNRESHPPLDWNVLQALYLRASGAEEKAREGHGNSR